MPTSALHPCPTPGCRTLVRGRGPCSAHRRKAWDHQGRSRQARGYGATHERLRARVLREEPGCAVCGVQEEPTVDHIIPLARGGRTERANLRRLCLAHQQEKAAREGNEAKDEKSSEIPPRRTAYLATRVRSQVLQGGRGRR